MTIPRQSLLVEARVRGKRAINHITGLKFQGRDMDPRVLSRAQENAKAAGVGHYIQFIEQGVSATLTNPLARRKKVL